MLPHLSELCLLTYTNNSLKYTVARADGATALVRRFHSLKLN
jgi:hypothetical protein